MAVGGLFLRLTSTALRAIEFGCAAVALALFSYFLATLSNHHLPIASRWKAVEGISGAGVLYTIFGVILTCFLGGITVFGFLAIVLDILFAGGFIAIAYLTRHGAGSCRGIVNTPLGIGPSDSSSAGYGQNGFGFSDGSTVTYFPNLHTACRMNTAVFAVSIIAIFLFLITAFLQIFLIRHHKKEKRYGPSPSNNYTSGRGRFWRRNKKVHTTRDAEAATALPGTHHHHHHDPTRPSGDTLAGSTHAHVTEPKYGQPGYGQATNY